MDPDAAAGQPPLKRGIARRPVLRGLGAGALTTSTPATVNPVAVVAQAEDVPCLATNDPWESWYAGLGSNPAPGVAIIAPVGVQWKASTGNYPFEMKVADNSLNKAVKIGAKLEPTNA